MASSNRLSKDDLPGVSSEEDLAQVWKDLQKGEKTAQVLESNLTNLEKKIDDLLASFEESERRMVEEANGKQTSANDGVKKEVNGVKEGGDGADSKS